MPLLIHTEGGGIWGAPFVKGSFQISINPLPPTTTNQVCGEKSLVPNMGTRCFRGVGGSLAHPPPFLLVDIQLMSQSLLKTLAARPLLNENATAPKHL